MKVLGIDLGTTGICAVVLDAETGGVVKSTTVNSDAFISTCNAWEKIQDVSKIISVSLGMLDSLLGDFEGEIIAIGLTGQMHGILYVDKDGKAVSPLYTWQDGRGNLPYKDTTYAAYLGSFSGYGNVTDFYNRENGLVPADAVTYCTVHDYLGMVLCNNKKPILHSSDAASLGLYNPETKSFDYDYAERVTDGFEIIGKYREIPVSVAIGDNQASVFATLADENSLLINVGTGSQISIVSDHPISAENVESRPYFDGKYLVVGAALCGGRAYSLLREFYKQLIWAVSDADVDVYAVMDRLLKEKEETTLKVDTRFAGTRSNPNIRGSITNLSVENFTPSDLTAGVLCGMIDELYGMYLAMGEKRVGIIGSGNGLRKNKALVHKAEKSFGGKLRVPIYTEEAACGAALFALVACGKYRRVSEVQGLIKYAEG
ncbi:MAG: hypothetical protein E7612_06310 [Ruminococcaceae bacterium]|nr:hypothetical protein [Oscillospiraceae bacterium]